MNNFEFNGDWETSIDLIKFEPFYKSNFTEEGKKLVLKSNKQIYLRISDKYGDLSPDPMIEQINTINYLLQEENQVKIIESIIKYLNNEIYPFYKANVFSIEEYPDSYPVVQTLEDFQKYFQLESIEIHFNVKDEFTYYSFSFDVGLLDDEHGLSIDLHKDRCIEHGPGEGTDHQKIVEELNLAPDLREQMHKILDNEKAIIYKPHPKYGKLKPWQIDANRRFPINAYKNNEDELLIESIEKGIYPITQFGYIYQLAKKENRSNLIKYFEKLEHFKNQ